MLQDSSAQRDPLPQHNALRGCTGNNIPYIIYGISQIIYYVVHYTLLMLIYYYIYCDLCID